MNKLILSLAGLVLLTSLGFLVIPRPAPLPPTSRPSEETLSQPVARQAVPEAPRTIATSNSSPLPAATAPVSQPAPVLQPAAQPAGPAVDEGFMVSLAVGTLIAPQATFQQKQKAWKQLMTSGKLDAAIGEFERLLREDPGRPEYPSVLGQAYMKKCATTDDVRDQAMLAMKADQTLETALSMDPSNWDARFTKAVGMSYWPTQMNKGPEVIAQFQTLIQQQEAQTAQPQFARSYAVLGDQYAKNGQAEFAAQIWQRGATQFPNDEELKRKLAGLQGGIAR